MDQEADNTLELSPFDQAIARVYIRKLFCFPLLPSASQENTVSALRNALVTMSARWPFIAGTVGPAKPLLGQKHRLEAHYKSPALAEDIDKVFTVRQIHLNNYPSTYTEMSKAGMPPSVLRKEMLCPFRAHPAPGNSNAAFSLQANFLPDGLILCFTFHHTIFDGTSGREFFRAFAAATRAIEQIPASIDSATLMRLGSGGAIDEAHSQLWPEYDFDKSIAVGIPSSPFTTSRIFTFTSARLAELKTEVMTVLNARAGNAGYISTAACLNGLIWVTVMRARHHRLHAGATSRYAVAVDCRSRMRPAQSSSYFGNCVVHTVATAKVEELTTEGRDLCMRKVALAATRFREAASFVDDLYIRKRLRLYESIEDLGDMATAFKRRIDMPNTGLDFSDWRDQGADYDFSIPGTATAEPEWVRKTWSANEGAVNIMPRKGGAQGYADYEVLLALSVEDMNKVCAESELGGWTSRIVE